ncbi:hypothetical protein [Pseudoalteromonas denitrificans]|uniref:Lipoprotein n=1 Tax=Pseudoalteromonas denitrificans DSM 6059 TaxID=1123010 RepID=A0A1I1TQ51_9GAMM|nr:hypothetical protein [Pseudoalteromonas denitrificans]SFD60761.1 hypothetical protein SAMN02745724_04959 [Pseudoalteromonas denitrificans DSM 6059]
MTLFKYSIAALSLLAVTACSTEETESKNIKTTAIWVDMKIESNGSRSRVVAELNVGGINGTNVSLSSGDEIITSVFGQSKTLKKDTDLLDIDYQGYFDITSDNSLFNIALKRKNETDALQSEVELPLNFSIHSPVKKDHFSVNQNVVVSWDGLSATKSIDLDLTSTCVDKSNNSVSSTHSQKVTDDGSHVLALSSLEMFKNKELNKNKNCNFKIELKRKNIGKIDSAFKSGSSITASQIRNVKDISINI